MKAMELTVFIISLFTPLILLSNIAHAQDPYEGYTFYASGRNAYLYDMDKNRIHTWSSSYNVMSNAYLLRDSSVFFPGVNPSPWSGGAQVGGQLQIIKWDGEVVWNYHYSSSTYCPHHDSEPVYRTDDPYEEPTFLVICYEKISGVTSDKIVEIKPTGQTTADIVWEWHAWDHRTSNGDDKPELLDQDAGSSYEWTHVNNVSYNRELDQILFGVKHFYEFMVIDHSTTTEEAAGSTGGKYGKGGNIHYRWGRPSNYGCSGTSYLGAFHCARWIPTIFPGTDEEVPGGGNAILIHNNRDETVEVELPGDGDGIYPRNPGSAFEPDAPAWTADISQMSDHQGSTQRLPNGNTLVSNARGTIYEYAPNGSSVWSMSASCSKATRYSLTYLDMTTITKGKNGVFSKNQGLNIYSNPMTGAVHISLDNAFPNAKLQIFTLNGQQVFSRNIDQHNFIWNTYNRPTGMYIVKVTAGNNSISRYVHVVR